MKLKSSTQRAWRRIFLILLIGAGLITLSVRTPTTFTRAFGPADTAWFSIGPRGDFGSSRQPSVNGRIRSIHIQFTGNDYYVYAGASSGGVWRAKGSTGPVWASLGDRLPNPAVGAFAVHPNNPDDILVGTGDYARYAGDGMYRTTDAGRTWTKVALPVNPQSFFQIFYLPGKPDVVLAASDAGLLRSVNGPDGPWTVVLGGVITDLAIHPTNPKIQYGCSLGAGVYKTIDTWDNQTVITPPNVPASSIGNARIAICRDSPNVIAFVYEGKGTAVIQGIWKSLTSGIGWTNITWPKPQGGQADHALSIAIRPNNSSEIYVAANELWKTTNDGKDWPQLSKTIDKHQDHTRLYFSPVTGDDILWICSDGGIYRYRIGDDSSASWNGDNVTGLVVSLVSDMDAKGDFRLIGLQDDGAVGSQDDGRSWTGFDCCDVYNVVITDEPSFWYILDGNAVRQPLSFPPSPLLVDPSPPLVNGAWGHLFYDRFSRKLYTLAASTDSLISYNFAPLAGWGKEIALPSGTGNIGGSYLNGQTIFVWGDQPGVLTLLRRNGATWTKLRSSKIGNISGSNYSIFTVFASTERLGESWAGLSNIGYGTNGTTGTAKILHTTDDWQAWQELGPLPSEVNQVTGIVATPFNARQIFVATDVGVYWTQDGGTTWQSFQTGLPKVFCTVLRYVTDATFKGNDKLVVSTFGRGVYERVIPGPPIVYVDPRNNGFADGTFEHPYNTFDKGLAKTPDGGILALHGDRYNLPGSLLPLNRRITINAYEFPAQMGRQ